MGTQVSNAGSKICLDKRADMDVGMWEIPTFTLTQNVAYFPAPLNVETSTPTNCCYFPATPTQKTQKLKSQKIERRQRNNSVVWDLQYPLNIKIIYVCKITKNELINKIVIIIIVYVYTNICH